MLRAAAPVRAVIEKGDSFPVLLDCIFNWMACFPGAIGASVRRAAVPLRPRTMGCASAEIFPLPLLHLPRGSGRRDQDSRRSAVVLANIWVVAINHLHGDAW